MTAPQIGNYGVVAGRRRVAHAPAWPASSSREASPVASNWRADGSLRDYLVRHNIVAIADIDTRALTRVLRSAGVMRGVIATGAVDPEALVGPRPRAIPQMEGADLVKGVTCDSAFAWRDRCSPSAGRRSKRVRRRAGPAGGPQAHRGRLRLRR